MSSRSVQYSTNPLLASKTPIWRSQLIVACIALGFIGLVGRAVYVQVVGKAFFIKQGTVRFERQLDIPANRGRILDRNGLKPPTKVEIDTELEYQTKLQKYYQYAYSRCEEYPDGFEQLDMLWHAINEGQDLKSSKWFQTIKEVKEKFPKPEGNPPTKE